MRQRRFWTSADTLLRTAGLLCLVVGLAGCSKSKGNQPVEGSVVDSSDQPVTGVAVAFWPANGKNPITAVVDQKGRFTLRCPPGEYKVTFTPLSDQSGPQRGFGPLPAADPSAKPPSIPQSYKDPGLTTETATVGASGADDLKFKLPISDKK
jgi:hypothetical protein